MMQYEVKITDEALLDMEELYNYICIQLQSPQYVANQYNRIADAILTLTDMPNRYPFVGYDKSGIYEIRRMIVDNYYVFYTVDADKVVVTNVLYGASDIESRLKLKKI